MIDRTSCLPSGFKMRLPLLGGVALVLCVVSGPHFLAQNAKPAPHAPVPTVEMCTTDGLSLGTDDENDGFAGMSQNGTLLVVRNLGPDACRMPAIPKLALFKGTIAVKVTFTATPSSRTVIVPAGAEVTTMLHWVAQPVYDTPVCVTPGSLHLRGLGDDLETAFGAQICGDKKQGISVNIEGPLHTDPVYKPGK